MYRGSLQYFYWNKGNHESLDVVCPHLNYGKKQNEMIFVPYIYIGYSEWCYEGENRPYVGFFETFHQQCIIMKIESSNSSVPE